MDNSTKRSSWVPIVTSLTTHTLAVLVGALLVFGSLVVEVRKGFTIDTKLGKMFCLPVSNDFE